MNENFLAVANLRTAFSYNLARDRNRLESEDSLNCSTISLSVELLKDKRLMVLAGVSEVAGRGAVALAAVLVVASGGAVKTRRRRPARDDIITVKRCAAAAE